MIPGTEAATNGRTLEQLLQVSKDSLTARINGVEVMKSVRDDQRELSRWMEATRWSGLSGTVASHLCGYLQDNIVGIFAGAWCKFAELRKQALESKLDENATINVGLVDHEFSYELKPRIDIELNGKKVGEIPFTIAALFNVSGLELGLRKGCVNYVRTGKCEFSGTVHVAEQEVWRSPSATLDLPGEFHLMRPIPLIAEETVTVSAKATRKEA